MRIAFYISHPLNDGGAERVVTNLANAFASQYYDVTIITPFRSHPEYFVENSVHRYYLDEENLGNKISRPIYRIFRLRKFLKKNNIKVLFAFLDGAVNYSVLATRFSGVKVIVSERNDPCQYFKTFAQKLWIRTIYDLADAAVFQTPEAKSFFNRSIQKRSKIIYNPVRDEFYTNNLEPIANRIVTCGRYEPQKNHYMLIEAMNIAIRTYPNLKLSIYGAGALEKQLNDYINECGLCENVFIEGNALNVPNVLKSAEIFVLSSDFEGAPNALMEAMAMGVPSVSTDCPCGGPKMFFGNNENGLLVPVGDSQAMAEAICKLHEDKQLQKNFSVKGRIFAERFRMDNIFNEWKSIIEIALKK